MRSKELQEWSTKKNRVTKGVGMERGVEETDDNTTIVDNTGLQVRRVKWLQQ